MIQLNLDLNYLTQYFEISTQRLNQYANKSIEEIMQLEQEQGNPVANLLSAAMNDPQKLAKLLQLTEPKNRYLIIKNLSENDLDKLLPYLETQDLIWGIQYFRVDKIIELLNELPTEQLMRVVLQKYTVKDIFMLMPIQELDKLLENQEVERADVMKYFESLDPEELEKIMVHVFGGQMIEKNKNEQLEYMEELDDREFTKMLLGMKRQDKALLMTALVHEKPDLMEQVNHKDITRPMRVVDKKEILNSMEELDPEFLIPMVQELPPDLLQVVATQIDPNVFAEVLIEEFPDVLEKITL